MQAEHPPPWQQHSTACNWQAARLCMVNYQPLPCKQQEPDQSAPHVLPPPQWHMQGVLNNPTDSLRDHTW